MMKRTKQLLVITTLILVASVASMGFREVALNSQRVYSPSDTMEQMKESSLSADQSISGALQYYESLGGDLDARIAVRKAVMAYNLNHSLSLLDKSWEEMGPENIGGRTRAILWDNRDPSCSTVYVGGVAGGLFVSRNGTFSWEKVETIDANIPVSSICQAPDGTIFVGTGEDPMFQGTTGMVGINFNTGNLGRGLYRSKSASSNEFELVESTLPQSSTQGSPFAFINRVAFNPNGNVLYMGTNAGLYMSKDNGTTWISPSGAGLPFRFGTTQDIKVAMDGTVYYSIRNSGRFELCRSKASDLSGSETIFDVSNISQRSNVDNLPIGRIEIAVAPAFTKPSYTNAMDYIYIAVSNNKGNSIGVFKSKDKGAHWQDISTMGLRSRLYGTGSQGNYNNVLAMFPGNPNQILVGGIEVWVGRDQNVDSLPYIWDQRSISSPTQTADQQANSFIYIFDSRYVHADVHAFAFHPDPKTEKDYNTVLIGSDGGINLSFDGASIFQTRNKGYNVTQFYGLAVGNDGSLIGGTQDNSNPYIWKDSNANNMRALMLWSGDGGWSAISSFHRTLPTRRKALFMTAQYAACARTQGDYLDIHNDQEWNHGATFYSFPGTNDAVFITNGIGPFVTPMLLWETDRNTKIKDSIAVRVDSTKGYVIRAGVRYPIKKGFQFLANDSMEALVQNQSFFSYPFNPIIPSAFEFDTAVTVKVVNPLQSRLFISALGVDPTSSGGSPRAVAGVYMTDQAIDFSVAPPRWYNVFALDLNISLPKPEDTAKKHYTVVQTMALSSDGDVLYLATNVNSFGESSQLYRVKNLLSLSATDSNSHNSGKRNGFYALTVPSVLQIDTLSSLPALKSVLPANRLIASIAVDPNNSDNIIVTYANYVSSSENLFYIKGATTNNPTVKPIKVIDNQMPIYSAIIEMRDSNVALLGTDYGVYMISNLNDVNPGPAVQANGGMGEVAVYKIIQQTKDMPHLILNNDLGVMKWRGTDAVGAVYVATHGRGIFRNSQFEIPSVYDGPINLTDFNSANRNSTKNVEKPRFELLKIYPNPCTEYAQVEATFKDQVKSATVSVYDLNGKLVINKEIETKEPGKIQYQLSCENMPKGVYLVRVVSGTQSMTSKIIVK